MQLKNKVYPPLLIPYNQGLFRVLLTCLYKTITAGQWVKVSLAWLLWRCHLTTWDFYRSLFHKM